MTTPPRPPSGVIRVAYSGTFKGSSWANVMHVKIVPSGALNQNIANDMAILLHNAYVASFIPFQSLDLVLSETNIVLFGDNGQTFSAVSASPTSGQDSGVVLPSNVALVISWKASVYYRGGHPRTYLPGLVQDRLADSRSWSAQTIADFNAAAQQFRSTVQGSTPIGVTNVTFGYLQQFAAGGSLKVPREYLTPPVFHPIVGWAVHPRVDSQRRRLGREFAS